VIPYFSDNELGNKLSSYIQDQILNCERNPVTQIKIPIMAHL